MTATTGGRLGQYVGELQRVTGQLEDAAAESGEYSPADRQKIATALVEIAHRLQLVRGAVLRAGARAAPHLVDDGAGAVLLPRTGPGSRAG